MYCIFFQTLYSSIHSEIIFKKTHKESPEVPLWSPRKLKFVVLKILG